MNVHLLADPQPFPYMRCLHCRHVLHDATLTSALVSGEARCPNCKNSAPLAELWPLGTPAMDNPIPTVRIETTADGFSMTTRPQRVIMERLVWGAAMILMPIGTIAVLRRNLSSPTTEGRDWAVFGVFLVVALTIMGVQVAQTFGDYRLSVGGGRLTTTFSLWGREWTRNSVALDLIREVRLTWERRSQNKDDRRIRIVADKELDWGQDFSMGQRAYIALELTRRLRAM